MASGALRVMAYAYKKINSLPTTLNKVLAEEKHLVLAGIIGLIPNCASSVILTQLYLENIVTATTMISGLLVNAGVGLAVLFKMNKGIKQNILIVILLYSIGVISGLILQLIGINF